MQSVRRAMGQSTDSAQSGLLLGKGSYRQGNYDTHEDADCDLYDTCGNTQASQRAIGEPGGICDGVGPGFGLPGAPKVGHTSRHTQSIHNSLFVDSCAISLV